MVSVSERTEERQSERPLYPLFHTVHALLRSCGIEYHREREKTNREVRGSICENRGKAKQESQNIKGSEPLCAVLSSAVRTTCSLFLFFSLFLSPAVLFSLPRLLLSVCRSSSLFLSVSSLCPLSLPCSRMYPNRIVLLYPCVLSICLCLYVPLILPSNYSHFFSSLAKQHISASHIRENERLWDSNSIQHDTDQTQ